MLFSSVATDRWEIELFYYVGGVITISLVIPWSKEPLAEDVSCTLNPHFILLHSPLPLSLLSLPLSPPPPPDEAEKQNLPIPVQEVIEAKEYALTKGKSLVDLNRDFLERHEESLDHMIPGVCGSDARHRCQSVLKLAPPAILPPHPLPFPSLPLCFIHLLSFNLQHLRFCFGCSQTPKTLL